MSRSSNTHRVSSSGRTPILVPSRNMYLIVPRRMRTRLARESACAIAGTPWRQTRCERERPHRARMRIGAIKYSRELSDTARDRPRTWLVGAIKYGLSGAELSNTAFHEPNYQIRPLSRAVFDASLTHPARRSALAERAVGGSGVARRGGVPAHSSAPALQTRVCAAPAEAPCAALASGGRGLGGQEGGRGRGRGRRAGGRRERTCFLHL